MESLWRANPQGGQVSELGLAHGYQQRRNTVTTPSECDYNVVVALKNCQRDWDNIQERGLTIAGPHRRHEIHNR
jgi:hypothetical protein